MKVKKFVERYFTERDTGSINEICRYVEEVTGSKPNKDSVRKALQRLVKEGVIKKVGHGVYSVSGSEEQRANEKNKILNFIDKYCVENRTDVNVKFVALMTGIDYNRVKRYLVELAKEGRIDKVEGKRGYYISKKVIREGKKIYAEPTWHEIMLQADLTKCPTLDKVGVGDYLVWLAKLNHSPLTHRHKNNGAIVIPLSEVIGGKYPAEITVTIHNTKAKKILLYVKNSDTPFDLTGMLSFMAWLQGRFPRIPLSCWEVVRIGVNTDYKDLQVDGVKSVTLAQYKNIVFRIYNKVKKNGEQVMRREMHGWFKENERVSIDRAIDLFVKGFRGDDIEDIKKRLEGLESLKEGLARVEEKLSAMGVIQGEMLKNQEKSNELLGQMADGLVGLKKEMEEMVKEIEKLVKNIGVLAGIKQNYNSAEKIKDEGYRYV